MGLIAPRTNIARRQAHVIVQNPDGPPVPDGAGSYTQAYADANPPKLFVRVTSATGDLERPASGTVLSMATHIMAGPYHPQITTESRILWDDHGVRRTFNVLGPVSPEERRVDHEIQVAEIVT